MSENESTEHIRVSEEQRDIPVLSAIEKRLINANSPQEVILWTQVRGEILRQNEVQKEQEHRRNLEKIQIIGKIGMSVVTILTGIGLVVGGFSVVGFFILGAGLSWLAPDYVRSLLRRRKKSEGNQIIE